MRRGKRVCPRRDYKALVRVSGEGQAGPRHGVPEMETKVVRGWDTRWKVLERAWVVGMRGLEFQCSTECNTRRTILLKGNLVDIQTGATIQEVMHIYTMRRMQRCECSRTGMEAQ